jgi:hypothetical protein
MTDDAKQKARARALRAARAVTIAAALAIGTGCTASHSRDDAGEVVTVDAGMNGFDASSCPEPTWTSCCEPMPEECCVAIGWGGWDPTAGCCITCVEGPMVPPSAPV